MSLTEPPTLPARRPARAVALVAVVAVAVLALGAGLIVAGWDHPPFSEGQRLVAEIEAGALFLIACGALLAGWLARSRLTRRSQTRSEHPE